MTAALVNIRDEVYTRISLKKALSGFVFNDFTLEKVWLPYQRLETLTTDHPSGKVYVIGLVNGDESTLSRANTTLREVPVQVCYQRRVPDLSDISAIDELVEFEEQLRAVCRNEVNLSGFSWSRIESLKDNNRTPYSYVGLREAGTFEVYFTTFYNLVL